ncbi:hypothetical protein B0I35DRAFT_145938 [Stachybotrys elegans]|uniref:Uncharacterized protein n=1 Tax=Stachybotrys elegans TaxID=80388 RepID=A0A8K0SJL2_9HYPO|nr:hypothetical protein B0I35DRAFT_145938 [Stachybotrys elegans]
MLRHRRPADNRTAILSISPLQGSLMPLDTRLLLCPLTSAGYPWPWPTGLSCGICYLGVTSYRHTYIPTALHSTAKRHQTPSSILSTCIYTPSSTFPPLFCTPMLISMRIHFLFLSRSRHRASPSLCCKLEQGSLIRYSVDLAFLLLVSDGSFSDLEGYHDSAFDSFPSRNGYITQLSHQRPGESGPPSSSFVLLRPPPSSLGYLVL